MDKLIRTFTRVILQIDDADHIVKLYSELKEAPPTKPPSITNKDRRRLLDFPEPEAEAANIAIATSHTRPELLRRAVESPIELSASELELLERRFWHKLTWDESNARTAANLAWKALSSNDQSELCIQLRDVRAPLYDGIEAKAIENAESETSRRLIERTSTLLRQQRDRFSTERASWVQQLWTEDEEKKPWGYCVFVKPNVQEDNRIDDYVARRDGVLFHAKEAIGCGDTISALWRLHRLDWPLKSTKSSGTDLITEAKTMKNMATLAQATQFHELRKHFRSIREQPPSKRRRVGGESQTDSFGFPESILRNVFLVIDEQSFDSVLSTSGNVDDMWVWAVDVDYEPTKDLQEADPDEHNNKYPGHFRVRLQQLVHNFFVLRRFHDDEYPMEHLWQEARRSKNGVFVSVREEEIGLWTMNRTHGTALGVTR
jgi:hypothetical protein